MRSLPDRDARAMRWLHRIRSDLLRTGATRQLMARKTLLASPGTGDGPPTGRPGCDERERRVLHGPPVTNRSRKVSLRWRAGVVGRVIDPSGRGPDPWRSDPCPLPKASAAHAVVDASLGCPPSRSAWRCRALWCRWAPLQPPVATTPRAGTSGSCETFRS